MASYIEIQNLIAEFNQAIANKQIYAGHIKPLQSELEKLITGYGIFLFHPNVVKKINDYEMRINNLDLLSYAKEMLFSNVDSNWLAQSDIKLSFMTKSTDVRLLVSPQYKITKSILVKPIELRIGQLLEIYALSERNEQRNYVESILAQVDPWEQHNPYIDDQLDEMSNSLSADVLSATTGLPVKDVDLIPSAVKHLIFVLIESIFKSVESLQIDQNSSGADLIVKKDHYGNFITNSSVGSKADGSVLSALNISTDYRVKLNQAYFDQKNYVGYGVDDWIYFRTSYYHKFAISPSLGVMRSVNIAEYYNISSFS